MAAVYTSLAGEAATVASWDTLYIHRFTLLSAMSYCIIIVQNYPKANLAERGSALRITVVICIFVVSRCLLVESKCRLRVLIWVSQYVQNAG